MTISKLFGFVFVTLLVAILLATTLNNFLPTANTAWADQTTMQRTNEPTINAPRTNATKNYLPIIFLNSVNAGGAWYLAGNAGTNPANDFLGTTDAQPLIIKTNNTERVRVMADGKVGIGTMTPCSSTGLHVYMGDAGFSCLGNSAVRGEGVSDDGVDGYSNSGAGMSGISKNGPGVIGDSTSNYGVWGSSSNSYSGFFTGGAGVYVAGPVTVTGYLAKQGGGFLIDNPLDPANQYLNHSFVESPDMKNIYDGVVILDANGEAIVTLPEYFEALNRDFRYQLTAIGAPGPNLYIAQQVRNNQFKIAGGTPNARVSWQVTGIRDDAWAIDNRRSAVMDKTGQERGKYLYPQGYGQSDSMGINYEKIHLRDELVP